MYILVYIPCHTDFSQALDQAKRLRVDFESYIGNSHSKSNSLQIILSVNAYLPLENEKLRARELCDQVIYNGSGCLADINIANGFLVALDKKPDILWLLSTNDHLVKGSIGQVLTQFEEDPSIDLVVANALDRTNTFTETQIIDPSKPGFSYGVISGAIYRLERLFPYLHNGPFMAWTGWSHMAVMQSAMDGIGGMRVKTIPDYLIYEQRERDLQEAGKYYGHSLYGMLILGFVLKGSKRQERAYIRSYVYKNFYNFHLYSRSWKYTGQLISNDNYLAWNQELAESLIAKKTPLTFLVYKVTKVIPWEIFSESNTAIKAKRLFDKSVGQSKQYKRD